MKDLVFYHCSDIHLGKTYGDASGREARYEDFFRVFSGIIGQAIAEQVDGVVVAGDLFHDAQVSPRTFAHTVEILEPLRRAGIPVIAVEGNHDLIHRRERISWMEALCNMEYIHLLRPSLDAHGRYTFPAWDAERQCGGRLEIGGVNFYGVGYIGALAGSHVEPIVEGARATEENVLLFHVGVWSYCGTDIGNMTLAEALPLADVFKYVALGHGHKPYELKNREGAVYAYNPGSPERVNFGEANYAFKGFYRVRWNTGGRPTVERVPTSPRPMFDQAIALDGARNVSEAEARVRARLSEIQSAGDGRRPVVRIKLTGSVAFRPMEMSRQKVMAIAEEMLRPIHVEYENALVFALTTRSGQTDTVQSLSEVEREVVQALFAAQSRYQSDAEHFARLAVQVKEALHSRRVEAAEILDLIHHELQGVLDPEVRSPESAAALQDRDAQTSGVEAETPITRP